jgi:hypothetical protein
VTNPDRWNRILTTVRNRTTPGPVVAHLCTVAQNLLRADCVSICLENSGTLTPLAGSHPTAVAADQLQNLWGVGPAISAATESHNSPEGALLISDVRTHRDSRWLLLSSLSADLDLCAVSAFPLRSGGAHLGVLSAYAHRPLFLSADELADGLVLATIITEVLLGIEALDPERSSDTGHDPETMWVEMLDTLPASSLRVHQATGMLAERLHISMHEAQIRLRALAFRRGETLDAVSRSIIERHPIPELED